MLALLYLFDGFGKGCLSAAWDISVRAEGERCGQCLGRSQTWLQGGGGGGGANAQLPLIDRVGDPAGGARDLLASKQTPPKTGGGGAANAQLPLTGRVWDPAGGALNLHPACKNRRRTAAAAAAAVPMHSFLWLIGFETPQEAPSICFRASKPPEDGGVGSADAQHQTLASD